VRRDARPARPPGSARCVAERLPFGHGQRQGTWTHATCCLCVRALDEPAALSRSAASPRDRTITAAIVRLVSPRSRLSLRSPRFAGCGLDRVFDEPGISGYVMVREGAMNSPSSSSERWLTRRDAASYARLSEATIGREARRGRLRCAKVGGRRALRFRREWIDEWLARDSFAYGAARELDTTAPRSESL
jgi:excisionase family DNA binding protein